MASQYNAKSEFTFLTRSWSSMSPRSLPAACAILFPATKLPTMMDAGPTPTMKDITGQNTVRKISHLADFFYLQI